MSTQAPDSKLLGLSTLLQLEKDIRHADNIDKFNFLVVNDARRLIEFHQAVLWKLEPSGQASIRAVSGLAEFDRNAPYIIWLRKVFRHLLKQPDARQSHPVGREALPPALHVQASPSVPDRSRPGKYRRWWRARDVVQPETSEQLDKW